MDLVLFIFIKTIRDLKIIPNNKNILYSYIYIE